MPGKDVGRYAAIANRIFERHYRPGLDEIIFKRQEIIDTAQELGLDVTKNVGDVIYAFKFRRDLDPIIRETERDGKAWMIYTLCTALYAFVLKYPLEIKPNPGLIRIKVPDATPGIVARYAMSDEQSLLTRLRYNRLVDIFTGTTCYSLQNHLRTSVKTENCNGKQVETDEIYVGIDKLGIQYAFPIQAKNRGDRIGLQQIEDDILLCRNKFPDLVCRPLAAQFFEDVIALFELRRDGERMAIVNERHYRLVPPVELTSDDLLNYRSGLSLD